jgi:putative restriction endonuclease
LTFELWMRSNGLSLSSAKKYRTAIEGSLSDWGREAGLFEGSITNTSDSSAFAIIANNFRHIEIFKERDLIGNQMYSAALKHFGAYLDDRSYCTCSGDLFDIIENEPSPLTEKLRWVSARVGQGKFRLDLVEYWGRCAVTGYPDVTMLIASHVKPWSISTPVERLDKYNGLLLLPNLDRAFDSGLISFRNDGSILISTELLAPNDLGLHAGMEVNLAQQHIGYMEFHRDVVFRR